MDQDRIWRTTDSYIRTAPTHGEIETISEKLAYRKFIKDSEFETREVFERENIENIGTRLETTLVSNSESLINLRYANFSLMVSTSPCVGVVLTSLSVGLRIPSWSITLVAAMESIGLPTLSVYMGGCLKDTSFGV